MKYLLYGLGKSNISIKKYFDFKKIDYDVYIDSFTDDNVIIEDYDYVIKSPGIPNNTKLLNSITNKTKILTDIELFYKLKKNNKSIVVTGSNGKTTVTSLLGVLLKNKKYGVCGNIGIPIFDCVESNFNGLIIEASSYMLEYVNEFKPNVFVLLNIEQHHLEHHKTFENYCRCKFNPIKNMSKDNILIYNFDDEVVKEEVNKFNLRKYSFSVKNNKSDCYYNNGIIYYNQCEYVKTDQFKLVGIHNIKNIMAAILTCKAITENGDIIEDEYIINQINSFEPLTHRLEKFYETDDLIFINDSKSTNPFATTEAINSVSLKYPEKSIHLIMGGKKENFDYHVLFSKLPYLNGIYLYGECADKIKKDLKIDSQIFPDIDSIFKIKKFKKGVVLFSPGAPSFDQFMDFEKRGEYFKNLIIKTFKKNNID